MISVEVIPCELSHNNLSAGCGGRNEIEEDFVAISEDH